MLPKKNIYIYILKKRFLQYIFYHLYLSKNCAKIRFVKPINQTVLMAFSYFWYTFCRPLINIFLTQFWTVQKPTLYHIDKTGSSSFLLLLLLLLYVLRLARPPTAPPPYNNASVGAAGDEATVTVPHPHTPAVNVIYQNRRIGIGIRIRIRNGIGIGIRI